MARPKRKEPWFERRGDQDNGIFQACWYDGEKRRVRTHTLDTRDAEQAARNFAKFLTEGKRIRQPEPHGISVATALDEYYDDHVLANCAASLRQSQAIAHLKAFFKNTLLADVDIPMSRKYAEARTTGKIGGGSRREDKRGAPSTVRRELNVLKAAARYALKMKRTTTTIFVELPPERRLGQDDEAPYYTKAELESIFKAAADYDREQDEIAANAYAARVEKALLEGRQPPDEPKPSDVETFVRLLYQTGARRKSIENLTRPQVKTATKRILLQKPEKVATKKRQPIVPILKAMEPALDILLSKEKTNRLFEFTDYYRPYRRVAEKAGIDEARRHPHIMRHTRATHLLQDGKSIYDVARLLGDTVKTVQDVYGHHSAEHLAANLEG